MRTTTKWWMLAALSMTAGCMGAQTESGGRPLGYTWDEPSAGPTGRYVGQTEFESAGPWMYIWGPWLRALSAENSGDGSAQRVIEESDIFAFEGSTLFVLNPYRGLVSIDLSSPDRPVIVGRAPILGTPQEMYVRDGRAYVLMNDWFQWRDDEKFHGSQVLVVDVARPSAPALVGHFAVAGNIEDSQFVMRQVSGQELVFHLAALISIPFSYIAPLSYVRTNVEGTLNVLEASRQLGVSRVVHTSTSEVYGTALYSPIDEQHPLQGQSPYSASKIGADKIAESYHRAFNLPVAGTVIRRGRWWAGESPTPRAASPTCSAGSPSRPPCTGSPSPPAPTSAPRPSIPRWW